MGEGDREWEGGGQKGQSHCHLWLLGSQKFGFPKERRRKPCCEVPASGF